MGALCACELDATRYGLEELKSRLENTTRRVRQVPEVYVTIDELSVKDGGSIKFSPARFTLQGLEFKTTIEVKGNPADVAKLAYEKATSKVMGGLGVSAERKASFQDVTDKGTSMVSAVTGKVGNMMGKAGDMVSKAKGLVSPPTTAKIVVTVDMRKEFGEEHVDVTVKDFTTDHRLFEKLLSIDMARSFIEQAISEKASEVATKMAKKKVEEVTEKITGAT
mmetsp:Transcript_106856/g.276298  ORF Transcript_106856/g.276298 Transcript_106856/m.276298 type:complete len:222 (+) Transcript_106856:114-779(+)